MKKTKLVPFPAFGLCMLLAQYAFFCSSLVYLNLTFKVMCVWVCRCVGVALRVGGWSVGQCRSAR